MATIEKVHILSTGRIPDAIDPLEDEIITVKDLDELVDTYNPKVHEAPIVLGHDSDTEEDSYLSSDTHPAYGWIEKVYRDGNDLYVDIDSSPEFEELLDGNYFKKRSIAYYNRDSRTNPAKGKLSIRHVAYLGATPPRVKALEDKIELSESEFSYKKLAKFSDDGKGYKVNETVLFQEEESVASKEEAKEILNNNAKEWIAYILQDGQKGFKGGIKNLDPEPSDENFWLYNKDTNQWEGIFVAKDDRRFKFIIRDEGDGEWRMGFRLEEEGEPDLTESSEEEETDNDLNNDLEESTEMSDRVTDKKTKKTKDSVEVDTPKTMGEECLETIEENTEVSVENPGGDTQEGQYKDMKKLADSDMNQQIEEYMEKYMEKFMEKYMEKTKEYEDKDKDKDKEYEDKDKEKMVELEQLKEENKALKDQLEDVKKNREQEMQAEMLGFSEKLYQDKKLSEEIIPKAALQSLLTTLLVSEGQNMLYMSEADNKESLTHVYDGLTNLLDKLPKLGEDLEKMGELNIPKVNKAEKYSNKYSKESQDFDAQIRKYSESNKVSYKQAYDILKRKH